MSRRRSDGDGFVVALRQNCGHVIGVYYEVGRGSKIPTLLFRLRPKGDLSTEF